MKDNILLTNSVLNDSDEIFLVNFFSSPSDRLKSINETDQLLRYMYTNQQQQWRKAEWINSNYPCRDVASAVRERKFVEL